jgi:hypothetical protein
VDWSFDVEREICPYFGSVGRMELKPKKQLLDSDCKKFRWVENG